MPKCFSAFVALKHEWKFRASKLYCMLSIFAKIQLDARLQEIAPGKKFPAQTTTHPRSAVPCDQTLQS